MTLLMSLAHQTARATSLTERELEILKWSAEGKTSADIAAILAMKKRTVDFHIANAVRKMGVCNKIAAVAHAARAGMV